MLFKAGNELWYALPLWAKLLVAAALFVVVLVAIKFFPDGMQAAY